MKYSIVPFLFLLFSFFNGYPNSKEDVQFKSGEVTLSGTLYVPKGEGPFPAIVFVHGSGPETRKNSNYSAKWLASIGYVALAYDKRGTGESGGTENDWKRFSLNTLAEDAIAAVNFLKQHPVVDPTKIGIHATSQGGWVAALANTLSDDIRFMIIKSASVCTIEEDRIFERAARLTNEGFSEADLVEVKEMQLAEPAKSNSAEKFDSLFLQNVNKNWFPRVYGGEEPNVYDSYREWYGSIAYFDPVSLLNKSGTRICWVFGDPKLDNKGPVALSISNVESIIANKKGCKILQYNGQGHNIKESVYEQDVYDWLAAVNDYSVFKFKKH